MCENLENNQNDYNWDNFDYLQNECCKIYNLENNEDCYNISTNNILVFQFNIRSFSKNFDEFAVLIDRFTSLPHILIFTETWLSPTFTCSIDGFKVYHTYRSVRKGGGVSIYVRQDLESRPLSQLSVVTEVLEICAVQVCVSKADTLNIIGLYRPPENEHTPEFISYMTENILNSFSPSA